MFRRELAASQANRTAMDRRQTRPSILRPGLVLACAALLSAAGVTGLYLHRSNARATPSFVATEPPVIAVTVASVEVQPLPRSVTGDGSVVAWQELLVGAEVAGLRVAEVAVDEGDQVQRGQMLLHFDTAVLNAQADQTEAGVKEAEAALRFLQSDVTRAVELSHGAFIAPQSLEQRQSAARQAEARLVLARAHHQEAIARLGQAQLIAPADGIVLRRSGQLGTISAVGQEMFRLVRDGRLELDAKVPELELSTVQPGQTAYVLHGEAVIQAVVRAVAPTVATDSRLGIVHIALPAASGLRLGMFARVEILADATPVLVVPQGAVTFRGDAPAAFVVDGNNRVCLQPLTTGTRRNGLVEVLAGLRAGQLVVTSGAGFLADGDRVQVVRPLVVAEHRSEAGQP